MNVCLISPPTVTDFEDRAVAESEAVRLIAEHAPIGILSLAAVLEQMGITPQIIDLNRLYYSYLRSDRYEQLTFCAFAAAALRSESCDVFGFSTICSSYPLTLRIAWEIKQCHPGANVILGGPQASVVDVQTLSAYSFIDFIVRGEAEATLPMLMDALTGTRCPEHIPGLTFRKEERVVRTPNASVILDLDQLPMPALHLYPELRNCTYVPLELGRGCPFACTFCSTNDFFRRRFRLKSPQRMLEQMRSIKSTYGINTFDLIHDMFTVDRKKVEVFCEALLASGDEFYWSCSARTDCIDDELIDLMAAAGCRGIFFGIETGSPRLQPLINKNLNLDDAVLRIACANEHRIDTTVSLITGFPEETIDDVKDTVSFFAESLRFDYAAPQLHLLAPLADTPIHSQYRTRLIFDDIFSDMSYQGWRQDQADREMIREYPDVFPNFYAVPTPYLDRRYLKELSGFLAYGKEWFRQLLLALHEDSGGLLRVFNEFLAWRAEVTEITKERGGMETEPNRYYAQVDFRRHVLRFVRDRYVHDSAKVPHAVATLANYETALDDAIRQMVTSAADVPSEAVVQPAAFKPDSIPRLAEGVRLLEVCSDYKKTVRSLKRKGRLHQVRVQSTTIAIVLRGTDRKADVLQLSALSADILRLCDGIRTTQQICSRFSENREDVSGVAPETVCMFGLHLHLQQGLIAAHSAAA